jgi:hypothetical protein
MDISIKLGRLLNRSRAFVRFLHQFLHLRERTASRSAVAPANRTQTIAKVHCRCQARFSVLISKNALNMRARSESRFPASWQIIALDSLVTSKVQMATLGLMLRMRRHKALPIGPKRAWDSSYTYTCFASKSWGSCFFILQPVGHFQPLCSVDWLTFAPTRSKRRQFSRPGLASSLP